MDESTETIENMAKECIATRVRVVDRVVTSLYNEELRPMGIMLTQVNVLVVVGALGRARPDQVCQILMMSKSTLSRTVDRMSRKGWITAEPGNDARTRTLQLTEKGRAQIERVGPAWRKAQNRTRSILGEDAVSAIGAISKGFSDTPESHEVLESLHE